MIAMKPNGVAKAYYLKFRFITYPSKFQFIVIIRLLWLEWVALGRGLGVISRTDDYILLIA